MLPSFLSSPDDLNSLVDDIKSWAIDLGFADARVVEPDLAQYKDEFNQWLNNQYHAGMDYLANHGDMRFYPEQLHPGTRRVISLRMHYLPQSVATVERLQTKHKAYIARYALGRDYHKLIRKRLTQLAKKIEEKVGDHGYRAFVDSAPILERQIAEQAFGKQGLKPKVRMNTNNLETLAMLVNIGWGWSLLPSTLVDEKLVVLNLPDLNVERKLGVIHHKQRTLSRAAIAFIELLKSDGTS